MPSLEALNKNFSGKDFVILGIDIEEKGETVLKHLREYGISYDNLLDEHGEVSALYGVRSTPMKYIINTSGNVVGVSMGYREWDDDQMKSLVQQLMDEG